MNVWIGYGIGGNKRFSCKPYFGILEIKEKCYFFKQELDKSLEIIDQLFFNPTETQRMNLGKLIFWQSIEILRIPFYF